MGRPKDIKSTVLTCALVTVALVLGVTLLCTSLLLEQQTQKEVAPSDVVLSFWLDYLDTHHVLQQEIVVEQYFSCVDLGTLDHDGRSQTLRDLNSVVLKDYYGAVSYRVCSSKSNYVELMLLDSEGQDLSCRIGFYYRVAEGRISSYAICRLQPVSRVDSEWDGEWQ